MRGDCLHLCSVFQRTSSGWFPNDSCFLSEYMEKYLSMKPSFEFWFQGKSHPAMGYEKQMQYYEQIFLSGDKYPQTAKCKTDLFSFLLSKMPLVSFFFYKVDRFVFRGFLVAETPCVLFNDLLKACNNPSTMHCLSGSIA